MWQPLLPDLVGGFRVITPDSRGAWSLDEQAAFPEFATTGLRKLSKEFLGADDSGKPGLANLEAQLGDFADLIKAWHAGGDEHWRALVQQTATMWLDWHVRRDDPGLRRAAQRRPIAHGIQHPGVADDPRPFATTGRCSNRCRSAAGTSVQDGASQRAHALVGV